MSPNAPVPPNSEPEDPLEDDWADVEAGESNLLPPRREPKAEENFNDEQADAQDSQKEVTRLHSRQPQPRSAIQPPALTPGGDVVPPKKAGRAGKDVMPALDKLFDQGQVGPEDIEDKDWNESKAISFQWIALLGVGIVGLIIICLVMLHLKDSAGDKGSAKKGGEGEIPEAVRALNAALEDLAKRKKDAMDIYAEFASARVVEDIVPLIRNSAENEPLIRRTGHQRLVDQNWEPPYQSSWTMHISGGQVFARLEGELPDFSRFRAYFVIDQGHLVMDWKATTGYGTASFKELAEGRGDGSEIRGFISPSSLYTNEFPEDEFDCYELESPDGDDLIWCYVAEGTDEEKILATLFRQGEIVENDTEEKPITLKLKRGEKGGLNTQWLIETLHHAEWIKM